jgi:class 3 adenylate cyclase/TolB-like protein/Tfp pilus assembly protein PilF
MQPARRLAAILFTDIVGSTAIMQRDEQTALSMNKRYVAVLKQSVSAHGGEILNDYGDGSLCTFSSATQEVRSAIEIQQQLQSEPKVPLRIGLHVGEIFFEEGKVFGDGVNVASRVQSLGISNSILFSSQVNSQIKNQQEFKTISLGKFHFKNVDEAVEIFALTNEGLVVPDKKKIEGKLQDKKYKKNRIIALSIFCLLLVLSLVAYLKFFHENGFGGKEKSIAIIPFTVIGKIDDDLAEGLVEDVLVNLSKISELDKVISNRSSSKYINTKKSPAEIGEELNVNSLLVGTIQQIGDTIRVSTQLIESNSGNTLWAENYIKGKKQIFDLETELATQIVTALKAKLTPREEKGLSKRYTENVEAYKYYRRGRFFWNQAGKVAFDSAEEYYKKAIELEPDYALAYAGIADCHAYNFKGLSQLDEVPIAKAYTMKALSIDSTLSVALTTLGFIQQSFDYDWEGSKETLEKAIDLDPNNSVAHLYHGMDLIYSTPDIHDALKEMQRAVDLDPLSFQSNWILARNYYFSGKYELAGKQFKITTSFTTPDQKYVPLWSLGLIYLKQHLFSKAKEIFDQLPEGSGKQLDNFQLMQAYAYAVMGEKEKAKYLYEDTYKKYGATWHWHYRTSQVFIALGDFAEALDELEKGYHIREIQMFWIKADPAFDPIRNEPRFKALLKKMNLG